MSATSGVWDALTALSPKRRREGRERTDRWTQERADQMRRQAMDRAHRLQATYRAQEDHAARQFEHQARSAREAAVAPDEDEKVPAAT
jgi:hypothetical protein